jgi:ribosomal protein S18 acetylase RimI-like enzyme
MLDLRIIPLSCADQQALNSLMDEEVRAWRSELGWDYAPVRAILSSYVCQNLLPGYVALDAHRPAGYGYFLMYQNKGILGTIYVPKSPSQQEIADAILTQSVRVLKESDRIHRIEAQVMPFHGLSLSANFTRHGFQCFPRFFLELDLESHASRRRPTAGVEIIHWDPTRAQLAAHVILDSYRDEADALICEDYCTAAGCSNYLRSLVENPGCGHFLPDASFMGLDARGCPCGFILSSRISPTAGMIPQIAILPDYQGRSLGSALMALALDRLKAMGLYSVSLTVTKKNHRACEWYQRLGFKIRKEFAAYVWGRA